MEKDAIMANGNKPDCDSALLYGKLQKMTHSFLTKRIAQNKNSIDSSPISLLAWKVWREKVMQGKILKNKVVLTEEGVYNSNYSCCCSCGKGLCPPATHHYMIRQKEYKVGLLGVSLNSLQSQ